MISILVHFVCKASIPLRRVVRIAMLLQRPFAFVVTVCPLAITFIWLTMLDFGDHQDLKTVFDPTATEDFILMLAVVDDMLTLTLISCTDYFCHVSMKIFSPILIYRGISVIFRNLRSQIGPFC